MKLPPLYAIVDTAALERRSFPVVEAARAMLAGGARLLQFRHKGQYSRRVFAQAEQIGELCRRYGAGWIVDDRADIARLLGAGLHLGQDDLPPAAAREILGAGATIGLSTHDAEQLRRAAAEPVDYLAIGPIFPTGSKRNPDPVVGIEGLRRLEKPPGLPLVAIGGITRASAVEVLAAGADAVAVIRDLLPPGPLTARAIEKRTREWVQRLPGK